MYYSYIIKQLRCQCCLKHCIRCYYLTVGLEKVPISSDAKQKKPFIFNKRPSFFFKPSSQKNCFFIIIYNLNAGKCFLILWSTYSCYMQVVKHYIQHVNCIFIDLETNYLMNYNTNLHSNINCIITIYKQ